MKMEDFALDKVLKSKEDESVNFIFNNGLEARYVRREDDKVLVYLSSHRGCNQACRFCHLTQTGQTDMTSATLEEYLEQARTVLEYYTSQSMIGKRPVAYYVNFNFMARGEPLENAVVLERGKELFEKLREVARSFLLKPRFNISTIMPESMQKRKISEVVGMSGDIRIFYSAYTTDFDFRRRWIPRGIHVKRAGRKLREYFLETQNQITIHHALIAGENDSPRDLERIYEAVQDPESDYKTDVRFNLVRYNPFSPYQGKETPEDKILDYLDKARELFGAHNVQSVPRVGLDVYASCGTFIPK